jgi:hypothetical protein
MNDTLIIGLIVLAAILVGIMAGAQIRDRLPKHHLNEETKSLVSVSTAVVATVSALVLGYLFLTPTQGSHGSAGKYSSVLSL